MMRLTKISVLTLLGIIYPLVSPAQQTNTIYKRMASGTSASPFISANVPSIGQSYHLMYAFARNAPAKTCVTPNVVGLFEASFDNINFFPLTAGKLNAPTSLTAFAASQVTLTAIGLAPYIKIAILSYDNTNCVLDVYYSGSLYPTYVSKLENSRLESGYEIATFNQNTVGTFVAVPAKSTGGIFPAPSVAIYGIQCSNQTAQNIIVGSLVTQYMATNGGFVWPPTGLPYIMTSPGFGLDISLNSATTVSCLIQYRYEN